MHSHQQAQRSTLDVQWRDLVQITPTEKAIELSLPIPWLFGSLCAYHFGYFGIGAVCSFFFFLTGLRLSHGAQHYSLGIPRRLQDGVLFGLSMLMLACMHALQTSHMHHHRHCLEDDDAEGSTARLSWWQAILAGPKFIWGLHATAWRLGSGSQRRWIVVELAAIIAVLVWAFTSPDLLALRCHVTAMIFGECLAGFFAVWTVHQGCEAHTIVARTQRGRWVNRFFYSMFYHAEHHLFPLVPSCHLSELSERIDKATLVYTTRQVIQFRQIQTLQPKAASTVLANERSHKLARRHSAVEPSRMVKAGNASGH